ncbi:hypothetical protein A2964_01080 [Candidatus Daviesbacteria bacterium RIFCSPLOWO2_01_FULL_40_27]|nr:MAG: hypothetical protein A2964_01080 [Candidatus Daviesbacteria bacterium RIFCSPLOWO2_01_FULL_40_27]
MKIDIEIEDASLFTQVALVIDRQDVRTGISQLRDRWTDGKTYPTVRAWKDMGLKFTFVNDIIDLIVQNQISPVFIPVLEEAIITGKVTRFSRVLSVPIPRRDLAELYVAADDTISNEDYEYALITPLEATRREVAKEYGEIKQAVKRAAKREEPEDLTGYYELVQPLSDTKSEVQTHRKWYWQHLPKSQGGEGKSYYRIALDIAGQKAISETDAKYEAMAIEDTIRQAIKDYRHLIVRHSK